MSQKIHGNILRPARPDDIALAAELKPRFIEVVDTYARLRGVKYTFTEDIKKAVGLWRTAVARLERGDDRVRDDEVQAMRDVAQWTLDVKAELTNSKPKKIEWAD